VTSLTRENGWVPSAKTISFLDKCACRIARRPVHYADLAAELNANDVVISLLALSIVEQWPFVTGSKDLDEQKDVAEWITRLFVLLTRAGEDRDVIHELHSRTVNGTDDAALKRTLKKAYQKRSKEAVSQRQPEELRGSANKSCVIPVGEAPSTSIALEATFVPQTNGMESGMELMEGLERLDHEDLEEVLANGRLGQLCRSLSSFVEETRRQGFMTLQGMMKHIEVRRAA